MKPFSKPVPLPLLVIVAPVSHHLCRAQQLQVTADKTNGIYEVGDSVRWQLHWQGEPHPAVTQFRLLGDGLPELGSFTGEESLSTTRFTRQALCSWK